MTVSVINTPMPMLLTAWNTGRLNVTLGKRPGKPGTETDCTAGSIAIALLIVLTRCIPYLVSDGTAAYYSHVSKR